MITIEFLINNLNSLNDLISIHSSDYKLIWANSAFCKFIGKPLNELLDKTCFEILDCTQQGEDTCPHIKAIKLKQSVTEEKNLLNKGIPFLITLTPVYDSNNKLIAVFHVSRDISHIKKLEDEIKNKEKFYGAILKNTQDIITILTSEGNIVYESPSVKSVLGYEIEELVGKNFVNFVHPEDIEHIFKIIETGIQTPDFSAKVECRFKHKDGKWIVLETIGVNKLHDPAIKGILCSSRDISVKKLLAEELQKLTAFLQEILNNAPIGIIRFSENYEVIYENPEARRILGVPEGEKSVAIGMDIRNFPEQQKSIILPIYTRILKGERIYEEFQYTSLYNKKVFLSCIAVPLYEANKISGILMLIRDISDRKKLEEEKFRMQEELFQLQRIESIGKLAGGIAHDFNNLLTVINGNIDFLKTNLVTSDVNINEALDEVKRAADRAALLTSQLLAFSRKQVYKPKVIDINNVLKNLEKMLIRLIGEDIRLKMKLNPAVSKIKADPAQIEQVVINLVTNARDAMAHGGDLIISTGNEKLDENLKKQYPYVIPGDYVLLSVKDTGTGMTEEVKSRIFEPFFTTKEIGKGTGLGLAVVYGIVKQNKGFIFVESEVNKGTEVKIYLPVTSEREEGEETEIIFSEEKGGVKGETILVVEDEESVRKLIVKMLKSSKYNVIDTRSPVEALSIASSLSGQIHILVTDVVMPDMNGPTLARKLIESGKVRKVLYMSGYSENIIVKQGLLMGNVELIQKPFTKDALLSKIRKLLDK